MMGDECRRRGLDMIQRCRETLAAASRPVNPFRHDPDADECPICAGPCKVPLRRTA